MNNTHMVTASNKQQYEEEVIPHTAALRRFASHLTRNRADADDLVQETLLRAYSFWDRFQLGSNCRAWLFRIMKNQYINDLRIRSRRPVVVNVDEVKDCDLIEYSVTGRTPKTPEQELFSRTLDDDLTQAIAALGGDYRRVVLLCLINGYSYKQIAARTSLRLGTVKSRLYRGRKVLRNRLSEYAVRNRYVASYK